MPSTATTAPRPARRRAGATGRRRCSSAAGGGTSPLRRLRLAVIALAVAACVLGPTYLVWLRDSSLVRVESVSVSGLTTSREGEIRRLLIDEARGMTTLNVDEAALERAVATYPEVADVEATPDVPHGLAIEVIERRPIATVEGPGEDGVPVAADGTLLPEIEPREPLTRLPVTAGQGASRLDDEPALTLLAAVETAPPELAPRIETVERGDEGRLDAVLRDGPRVILGDDSSLATKWAAAAAALAEGDAAGAEYLDVSMPERPAAGG